MDVFTSDAALIKEHASLENVQGQIVSALNELQGKLDAKDLDHVNSVLASLQRRSQTACESLASIQSEMTCIQALLRQCAL